jgi:hypothetical protein
MVLGPGENRFRPFVWCVVTKCPECRALGLSFLQKVKCLSNPHFSTRTAPIQGDSKYCLSSSPLTLFTLLCLIVSHLMTLYQLQSTKHFMRMNMCVESRESETKRSGIVRFPSRNPSEVIEEKRETFEF